MLQIVIEQIKVTLCIMTHSTTPWSIRSNSKVLDVLSQIFEDDQRLRGKHDLNPADQKKIDFIDKINLIKVTAIVKWCNWPFDSFIKKESGRSIFLTIQHSPLEVQKLFLPLIKQAVALEKLKPSNIALIEDRIAIQEGRPQIYGTQIRRKLDSAEYTVFPIADVHAVDTRRKAVGLPPLVEYKKIWNIKD